MVAMTNTESEGLLLTPQPLRVDAATLQRPILEDAGRVRLGMKPNGPLF